MCKLWDVIPLLTCRLEMVQSNAYYQMLTKGLKTQNGDVFVNATNILRFTVGCPTENISFTVELMCFNTHICRGMYELSMREKGVAFAQEHTMHRLHIWRIL